jgi:hypothetical protein
VYEERYQRIAHAVASAAPIDELLDVDAAISALIEGRRLVAP